MRSSLDVISEHSILIEGEINMSVNLKSRLNFANVLFIAELVQSLEFNFLSFCKVVQELLANIKVRPDESGVLLSFTIYFF